METIISSLCRFKVSDEHLLSDKLVKEEIRKGFEENRCYSFYLDKTIIKGISDGAPAEEFNDTFIAMKNACFDTISKGDSTIKTRLFSDTRLSSRLVSCLEILHRVASEGEFSSLLGRRFVLIKEHPGIPTIFHISKETTVIAHIGQGPPWAEIPTIYLGIKTFDALVAEQKKGQDKLHDAFKQLLLIEERAIDTGFSHKAIYPPKVSRALNFLVDEIITYSSQFDIIEKEEIIVKKTVPKFTDKKRQGILKELNARIKGDFLNFDYERNLHAITTLERLARRYKSSDSLDSLREVVRLLVSASGHDIHEIRNRANLILERTFAPKEFDAPIATTFINLHVGDSHNFSFQLPESKSSYYLRIYKNKMVNELFTNENIDYEEVPLNNVAGKNTYDCTYLFQKYGHYDYIVVNKTKRRINWITQHGTSGRVNVIPDVRGELLLEIFPDIHGHAKTYWKDHNGHPGLLYNENGEVIRLGCFADITTHLEDLKERYMITSIYLLGTQKRGRNRNDWAPEASSPSPFSPMSLIDIEPFLGGEKEFIKLVRKAHSLDIKIIIDIVPHINRSSNHLGPEFEVKTYDHEGNLVSRASTDGRYGSWNDGKLLNYRKFETWEWLASSITTLIKKYDIDGIRFDSAHAVPIMMKKNNYEFVYETKRTHEEMVEGTIIVNDREDEHFITTGYYDCACRDIISVPIHFYLMTQIEKVLNETKKDFFIHIAECFWGHERFLTRTGLIPYNSSLFKICENVIHGKTDVREIYHIYDNYFPSVLPRGTELLGILGNHDERRALNTFGHRGLRAAVGLTCFMSNIIMDYEGSAEGEGWKVFLDNVYVNWNQFEYASHRSLEPFYQEWYRFHRTAKGKGYLVWANNNMVAAALKKIAGTFWIGAFNFTDYNQHVALQFDNPTLPIDDNTFFKVSDPLYSDVTGNYNYYTGSELKISQIHTMVSYTDRVKLLKLEEISIENYYDEFLTNSFQRLTFLSDIDHIKSNYFFSELEKNADTYAHFSSFIMKYLIPNFWENLQDSLKLGIKRALFYLYKIETISHTKVNSFIRELKKEKDERLAEIGNYLAFHNRKGSLVFMSAEVIPFSKSGGLANVVYELPRELVKQGEKVYAITALYHHGDENAVKTMQNAVKKYNITYTGKNVSIKIMDNDYTIGVHHGMVDGIEFYMLDHYEFFDGLYWGFTGEEKLRKRVAFARACAEVIVQFNLNPLFTFTNDAFAGLFNGIVRCDSYYMNNSNFIRNNFLHLIHNCGWQYFDSYHRYENDFDLFNIFNLPSWRAGDFLDPVFNDKINCMAAGIKFADRTVTVSPSYARQIEYAADGLEHILHDVLGISNAIGNDFKQNIKQRFRDSKFVSNNNLMLLERIKYDSKLHDKIGERYPEILKGSKAVAAIQDKQRKDIITRMQNKLMLQMARGLTIDPDLILFTFIHRISEQKGFQLLLESSEGVFKNLGFQAIIGGAVASGDQAGDRIAHGLYLLSQYYPDAVNFTYGFQDVSIPLCCSDLFLMPSLQEPGGISQLEAFAMGCLVVARATGGLRDTVFPVSKSGDQLEGNGFLFTDYSPSSFYDAMKRASHFFNTCNDNLVYKARKNAENSIYFWDKSAREYIRHIYYKIEMIRPL